MKEYFNHIWVQWHWNVFRI